MESGIGDFFGDRYEQARKQDIRTLKDYLPLFADKPLEFAPGTQRRYSNGGYIVLGLIVERITGIDYYDYVARNIFTPAGMLRSGWFDKSDHRSDIARGYTGKNRKPNDETLPQKGSSAGGGYCTAGDLLRYVQAIRRKSLMLPGSDEGLGIAGGAPGLNAALEWIPGENYVIVVLSNFDPPTAEKVARRIRETLPESQPVR
jgi:CubicO group peptidase (beta-lactamase class C family)